MQEHDFRGDELHFRNRRRSHARRTSWPLLVVLLFAGTVFLASVAVYFVNGRASSYERVAGSAKPRTGLREPIRLPVDQAEQDDRASSVSASDGDGPSLYKCKGPKGESTYTSSPCPSTQETVWVRSVQPDNRVVPPSTVPARNSVQQQQTQIAYSAPDPPSDRDSQRMRCANAKQYEADVRRRRGLKITFDELRQLSDMVYEACKGL
ncbi:hypothetical protein [Arenimonas sp.]|uniref:hypothetical protein n=1 Tax=Arenimonas sp. TaxID=1872635 RepID=UPI0039E2560A